MRSGGTRRAARRTPLQWMSVPPQKLERAVALLRGERGDVGPPRAAICGPYCRRAGRSSRGASVAHCGERSVPGERQSCLSKASARAAICARARSICCGVRRLPGALAEWDRSHAVRSGFLNSVLGLAGAFLVLRAVKAAVLARGVVGCRAAHEADETTVRGGEGGLASKTPRGEKTLEFIEPPSSVVARGERSTCRVVASAVALRAARGGDVLLRPRRSLSAPTSRPLLASEWLA